MDAEVFLVKSNRHQIMALILVLLFGSTLFYIGTDGFQVYTAEEARVNQLMEEKPQIPEVTFEDSAGRVYSTSEFEDKHLFITFFYTSCSTVCPQLEMNMSRVYDLVPDKYIGEDIMFLSISFDPAKDDPATLQTYQEYFDADGETWRMARISDKDELDSLLEAFGVIVIPDEKGDFAHNSAFYLVDQNGSLTDVMDYTKVKEAADKVVRTLERKGGGVE